MIKLAKPSKHLLNLSTFLAKLAKVLFISEIMSNASQNILLRNVLRNVLRNFLRNVFFQKYPPQKYPPQIYPQQKPWGNFLSCWALFEGSLSGIVC